MRKLRKPIVFLLAFAMLFACANIGTVNVQAAKLKTVTVSTQQELNDAMADSKVGTIIFKTSKTKKLITIPDIAGAANKNLILDAPKAKFVNEGSFKKITIRESKKFTESGTNNTIVCKEKKANIVISEEAKGLSISAKGSGSSITVEAGAEVKRLSNMGANTTINITGAAEISKLTSSGDGAELNIGEGAAISTVITNGGNAAVNVEKDATISNITLKGTDASLNAGAGAEIKVTNISAPSASIAASEGSKIGTVNVNAKDSSLDVAIDGALDKINVNAAADVSISGKSEDTKVSVSSKAEGAAISTSTPIDLSTSASISVDLKEGAENAKIETTNSNASVDVANGTNEKVTINTPTGEQTVDKGATEEVKAPDDSTSEGGSSSGGSGEGGGIIIPPTPTTTTEEIKGTLSGSDTVFTIPNLNDSSIIGMNIELKISNTAVNRPITSNQVAAVRTLFAAVKSNLEDARAWVDKVVKWNDQGTASINRTFGGISVTAGALDGDKKRQVTFSSADVKNGKADDVTMNEDTGTITVTTGAFSAEIFGLSVSCASSEAVWNTNTKTLTITVTTPKIAEYTLASRTFVINGASSITVQGIDLSDKVLLKIMKTTY